MKKAIRLFLICICVAAIALTCLSFTACKENNGKTPSSDYGKYISDGDSDLSIGVLADIHVMSVDQAVDITCADFKTYETKGQKMLGLSESILKTAVDRIIEESDLKIILLSGDNADDGGEISHRAVARELKRLEDAGIKVFTIPGNHDINNRSYTYASGSMVLTNPTTEAEFASIYKDFGYSKSDVKEFFKNAGSEDLADDNFADGDNLSYVADLSDEYRLIAIDMSNHVMTNYLTDGSGEYAAMGAQTDSEGNVLYDGKPYPYVRNRHDGHMTEDLLLWAKQKTEEAIADGKIPLGMMHFPLIKHFGPMIQAANMQTNNPEGYSVADVLADAGMKFIFTGHIHIQDNAIYTSKAGNKILDINSASLANYPTPIRVFHAKGEEARIRTWNMNSVKEDYLPTSLPEADQAAILSDFHSYSVGYIDESMLGKVKNTVDLDMMFTIIKAFGIKKNGTNDAAVDALANSIYNELFLGFVKTPLYKKDAREGQTSVEAIAEKYGVSIPASNYTTVFNLAMSYASALYGGDESVRVTDDRYVLLKNAIFSFFEFVSEFDLFGKLRALNANVAEIDLAGALPNLFQRGMLDVCSTNLLVGVVSSLDIAIVKKYLNFNESTDPYKALESVKKLANTLNLKDMLFGLDVGQYITANASQKVGFIKLGALMDACFSGPVLLSLANDSLEDYSEIDHLEGSIDLVPGDNNIAVNVKTMAYSAL